MVHPQQTIHPQEEVTSLLVNGNSVFLSEVKIECIVK